MNVQSVVICTPGVGERGACPEGMMQSTASAYVLMPDMPMGTSDFDAGTAGQFFAFSLSLTVALYFVAYGCGLIFRIIKNA